MGTAEGRQHPPDPEQQRHQSSNPVLIQPDFGELEDEAQAGQAPGPHTATRPGFSIPVLVFHLDGACIKGVPENQHTVKAGAHQFHRINLPECRNAPLTCPCAKQSLCPGQRTQTNKHRQDQIM